MDRQRVDPVFRLKIKDWLSIKVSSQLWGGVVVLLMMTEEEQARRAAPEIEATAGAQQYAGQSPCKIGVG